jgi:hypothetical protein
VLAPLALQVTLESRSCFFPSKQASFASETSEKCAIIFQMQNLSKVVFGITEKVSHPTAMSMMMKILLLQQKKS